MVRGIGCPPSLTLPRKGGGHGASPPPLRGRVREGGQGTATAPMPDRRAPLALKLAAVRILTEARGQGPLLLLDDVAGELDKTRAARLLQSIDEHKAQAFVTTTDTTTLPPLGESAVFAVQKGRLVDRG